MHAKVFLCSCAVAFILPSFPLVAATQDRLNDTRSCRVLPGDSGWPTDEDWSQLNSTIGGRLVLGTPLAQSCHLPTLDAGACDELQENWVLTET